MKKRTNWKQLAERMEGVLEAVDEHFGRGLYGPPREGSGPDAHEQWNVISSVRTALRLFDKEIAR